MKKINKVKKIIIIIFTVLIIATVTVSVIGAISSYRYDMDPANGVDLLEGIGAVLILVLGGLAVFYEFDLFFTIYYFVARPKTKLRTALNIIAHLCLISTVFCNGIARLLSISEEIIVFGICALAYIILRSVYLLIVEC